MFFYYLLLALFYKIYINYASFIVLWYSQPTNFSYLYKLLTQFT